MSKIPIPSTSKDDGEPPSSPETPPHLNILGESFDPVEALYTKDMKKAKTGFKQFSNLSEFEVALEKVGIQQVGRKPSKSSSTASASVAKTAETQTKPSVDSAGMPYRRFQEHQMPVKGRPMAARHSRNLLSKMEEYKQGPLSVLHNAWKYHKQLIVYLRRQHGVRGYMFGYLVAFDKHTNLLMKNCVEIWKRRKFKFSANNMALGQTTNCEKRLRKLGIKLPEVQTKSLDRKNVIVKRQLDQIVIRGEQVCLMRLATKADLDKLEKCIL